MKKLALLLLLLLLLAGGSNLHVAKAAQLAVYPFPAQQSSNKGRHLSSSSHNGDVFVGAGGTLYRLSSELQQLQSMSLPGNILGLTTTADGDCMAGSLFHQQNMCYVQHQRYEHCWSNISE